MMNLWIWWKRWNDEHGENEETDKSEENFQKWWQTIFLMITDQHDEHEKTW